MNEDKKRAEKNRQSALENWLKDYAEWRFNTLSGNVEYFNGEHNEWRPVDTYDYNTLKRKIQEETVFTYSTKAIEELLKSSFSPKVDPILQYFERLGPYKEDEPDYIQMLCNTVISSHPHKTEFMRKWLVGVVANVFNRQECDNQLVLLFRGAQGIRKSKLAQYMCPKILRNYKFSGNINTNMQNKDNNQILSQNLIVILDDCVHMNLKLRPEETKGFVTLDFLQYRAPYGKSLITWPRNASLLGTMNEDEVFYEHENRRFILIDLTRVEWNDLIGIDMDDVYRQAKSLWKSKKFHWHLNRKERKQLQEVNQHYMVSTKEEQMILKYFELPVPDSDLKGCMHLPPAEIESYIAEQENGNFRSTPTQIGRAMKALGNAKVSKSLNGRRIKGYWLKPIELGMISSRVQYRHNGEELNPTIIPQGSKKSRHAVLTEAAAMNN